MWFLRKIVLYLTSLQDPDAIIISDQLKGITSVVTKYFPFITYTYSSKHLYDNMRYSYGEVVAQKFRRWIYAKTESAFDKVLTEIKDLNNEAAKYIKYSEKLKCHIVTSS